MAGDSTAKQPDKRASPLTVSFRDTAFANFVNSDNSTQQLAPKQQIPQSTITQLRPSNPNTPQRRGTVGSTETYNSSNIQLARPTQLTTAGSAGSHAIDDDDMWLNSDFIDINSQEILDMVLAEEQMFATQQFLASNDVSVSQEFTEPRAMNAKDMQMNARDTRDASNAVTRSVPVTPSAIEPIYISDTETPGRVSADESACGSTGSVKILSLDGNSRPQPPSGSSTSHPVRLQNQSSQQDAVSRGKVNLFPRLAKHIPSSARPQFHSSSQTATNIQRPPIRPPPSAALNDASINRMQQPRLQNQQQYTTRYSQRMRPPPSLGPFNTDPGTASVSTNASVKRHSPYSSHPSPLRRSTSTNNPQTDSPHYPPPHIPHPSQPPSSSNGMAAELERLRAENTRIKSEAEQLKLQLYTKEGEVKIVRENLAKTEIDNTHLQEQLSNQIATANATQKSSEARLRADIERLQTELLFYQQEAQAAAIVKTPRSNNHTPSTQRRLTRMDGGTQEVAVHVATQSKNANGMAVDPPVSASKPYPTMDDFVSTPSTAVAKHQTPSSGKTAGSVSKHGMTQPARDNKDALEMAAKKENLALLGILEEIARQPINKAFGSLVALSLSLSQAIRHPGNSEMLKEFHVLACKTIVVEGPGLMDYRQVCAVLQLLLRVVDGLPAFRAAWLHVNMGGEIADKPRNGEAEINLNKQQEGNHPCSQMALALTTGLRRAAIAVSQIHTHRDSVTEEKIGSCGSAIGLYCRLLLRIMSLPNAIKVLGDQVWTECSPCVLGQYISSRGMHMEGVLGILDLAAAMIKEAPMLWTRLRQTPGDFETLLLSAMARLRVAFATNDPLMLEGEHAFLVLVASAMMNSEDDSAVLLNSMNRFTRSMVLWFLDEHQAIADLARSQKINIGGVSLEKRVQVFCQYIICLKVVLSEVSDVVELLGGDYSPTFFAFVAACTRMTVGEGAFARNTNIHELAADLLAYVVTEEQALSIQNL